MTKKRFIGYLSLLILSIQTSTFVSVADESEWVSLFNGRSIVKMSVRGGFATFHAASGAIVGKTAEGSKNSFLCTDREYGDFEIELEVKCDPQLNSGIQIRSHVYEKDTPQVSKPQRIRKKGEVFGYQCEITNSAKGVSGNFWDEGRRTRWLDDLSGKASAASAFKDGEWNHYRIRAFGDRIQSWVNGVVCADFTDDTDSSGFIGLQVHGIKKGSGPYEVRWRNIRLRELR
jgi:hypothetical protein